MNNIWKCTFEQCDKTYDSRGKLNNHIKYKHKGMRCPSQRTKIICEICGMKMTCGAYSRHLKKHNGNSYKAAKKDSYPCEECDAIFKSFGSLQYHKTMIHPKIQISNDSTFRLYGIAYKLYTRNGH